MASGTGGLGATVASGVARGSALSRSGRTPWLEGRHRNGSASTMEREGGGRCLVGLGREWRCGWMGSETL